MGSIQNPSQWRYTWEALSHISTLRLFLFSPKAKPQLQCKNLNVSLESHLEKSLILVSWVEFQNPNVDFIDCLLRVPVPRVLIDPTVPLNFKAMVDHIEVKLVLVLPVDHPLVVDFDSVFDSSNEVMDRGKGSDHLLHLSLDTGIKTLSSKGDVHFYCRSCSTKLTKRPLRSFMEMPSVNWREVADNWFGACCCSFGGASEKLVSAYENSSGCGEDVCLVDGTSIIICTDDLEGCAFPPCRDKNRNCKPEIGSIESDNKCAGIADVANTMNFLKINVGRSTGDPLSGSLERDSSMKDNTNCYIANPHCSSNDGYRQPIQRSSKWSGNGSLGGGFMVRTSNISKDIDWIEFRCFGCSFLVGSYPCANTGFVPVDGGVRLFKYCVSTSELVGGPEDIFRKYTLQRIFMNQILESAKDELSFRTVVRDLRTKSSMLQLVLLNSNAWCCTGYCLDTKEESAQVALKIGLQPVVKVLFRDCSICTEAESRIIEEWATKNQADEVYMMKEEIKELLESLKSSQASLPFSYTSLQGLTLSSMER